VVENGVTSTHGLDRLVVMVLSVVLVLLMRFALPTANKKGRSDVADLVADLDLYAITDELGHGSPFSDVIFEGVDELLLCFGWLPDDNKYTGTTIKVKRRDSE
jgi:hypothetical protein